MQSSPLSTPPSHNPSGLGINSTNPVQPSHGLRNPTSTSSSPSIPASGILSSMANGQGSQRSITPTFPVPQRHGTEPTVSGTPPTMHPLRPIQSAPIFPVPQPSLHLLSGQHGSSNLQQGQETSAAKGKALFDNLVYPEGEIPVFDKADADLWRLIRSEPVVTQKRIHIPWWKIWKWCSSRTSWIDAHGILLDSHFLVVKEEVVKEETSPTGVNKSTHVIRPIPLEYLSLASFTDDPEDRELDIGCLKQIGSCIPYVHKPTGPRKEPMHPFTIYHVAAKITRRQTIYTKTKTKRNEWKVDLEKAIESRKSQQYAQMLYAPQVFNDGFFKVPPRIRFDREAHYTGRVTAAALFAFRWEGFLWESRGSQRENYIAIGCTSGIYVSRRTERTEDYSFRKILESNEPSSIVTIPESNKFLVHCESTLSSYPLDKVIRASRAVESDAAIKDLGASVEKLNKDEEHVMFLKAGHLVEKTADPNQTIDRIVVIYAVKSIEKVTSHVLEVKRHDPTSQDPVKYLPLGPPVDIPEEPRDAAPHDATCFADKVAICTSKAIYFVEPMNKSNPPPVMVPRVAKEAHETSKLPKSLQKGKKDKPKIVELVGKASVLGMVTYDRDQDFLLVYDNLGCFVDQAGKPARTDFYYIEWERKATAFARRGPHLLLFSPGYIEVRNIDTGKLFRMVEVNELRLLRSGLSGGRLLIGVMTGAAEGDGSRTEKLVELIYHGTD